MELMENTHRTQSQAIHQRLTFNYKKRAKKGRVINGNVLLKRAWMLHMLYNPKLSLTYKLHGSLKQEELK